MSKALVVRRFAQALIVALPLVVGAYVLKKAVDVPYWDEWEWTDLIYSMHQGTLQFADLWAQHSEHRMLFPNLLMLGLARAGGWDPVREQFVSLALLVLCQLAIVSMIRRYVHGTGGFVAAAAASVFMYGFYQAENFSWGFQTAWFICDASAIVVALLLTRRGRTSMDVFLAFVIALIGTYSSSQGILAWVVGVVAILFAFRKRALTLSIWVPAGIVAYLIYRHNLAPVADGHFDVLHHPLAAVRYMLSYLGSPLGRWRDANVSALAGIVLVIALGAAFVADSRSDYRIRRFVRHAPWYALAAFPILCAAGTALGRGSYGVNQALASRYTSVSMLAWVALIGLLADLITRIPRPIPGRTRATILTLGTACALALVAGNLQGRQEWREGAATLALARTELINSDPAALPKLYPSTQRIIMLIGKMRDVHDGLFAGP